MAGGTKSSHAPAQSHSSAQSHAPAHAPPPSAELDFTALLGCLVVTFSVIGLGYVAQRTGFFDRNTKAGLGQFVGKVALPALLFKAISTLELGSIDPAFIAGVGLCKATAFVLVLILAKLMRRSLSECAIWAVFVSNSNDIALGYPVFLTLYPPFAHQIFITASLQIGLINPLAIILMEYDATRRRGRAISTVDLALRVGWQTLRNPLVLMVLAGAGANWLWAASPPPILVGPQGLFTVLGNAFMAVALVLTGAGGAAAVATPRRDRGSSGGGGGGGGGGGSGGGLSRLGVSAFLTVVTTLVYPMLCRAFVSLLVHRSFWATGIAEQPLKGSGGGAAAATVGPKLLDLTFLYGTLPTAPSTVVIAQAAGEVIAGEIAAAAVFNMVVAAPLAFTSTVLMTVRSLDSLRRAVRMFSELCLGGTAVGAFWVLLTTAAAARAAAADGGGGSGGVSGGGGGGAALGSIAHLATAQLGYAFGQFACQWRQKSGGPLRVALHAARTACTCWTAIVAAEAAAPERLRRARISSPRALAFGRLGGGWGFPAVWALTFSLVVGPKPHPLFPCWMPYGRVQYVAEGLLQLASLLLHVAALLQRLQLPALSLPQALRNLSASGGVAAPLSTTDDSPDDDEEMPPPSRADATPGAAAMTPSASTDALTRLKAADGGGNGANGGANGGGGGPPGAVLQVGVLSVCVAWKSVCLMCLQGILLAHDELTGTLMQVLMLAVSIEDGQGVLLALLLRTTGRHPTGLRACARALCRLLALDPCWREPEDHDSYRDEQRRRLAPPTPALAATLADAPPTPPALGDSVFHGLYDLGGGAPGSPAASPRVARRSLDGSPLSTPRRAVEPHGRRRA